MGSHRTLTRPDQGAVEAYVAGSEGGPGVVVLQEWFGVTAQLETIADRLAEAGYRAVVPDLYHGRRATDVNEAQSLMAHLDFDQAIQQDVPAAIDHLRLGHPKVAALGFGIGGALAILAAARDPALSAVVSFYGVPPAGSGDLSATRAPVLTHFAERDEWCTAAEIARFQAAIAAPHASHHYAAHHGFMNDVRAEAHDPAAASIAWERTLTFLNEHLR